MFFASPIEKVSPVRHWSIRCKGRKMNKNLLLLVEDNPLDVALIKEYLAARPPFLYDLMEADSLRAALSLLAHHDFDVVLLDLDLPDSSGLDTARRVITEYAETAILVLADGENDAIAQQAVRYGAEDYLEKNLLSSALLCKSIHYAIGRKRVLQEKYDILSDLVLALEKIDHLESLLPICLGCKKILHQDNHWMTLEEYVHQAAGRKVIRPLCPDCRQDIDNN
jgi:CheY-like chemotaxis protein